MSPFSSNEVGPGRVFFRSVAWIASRTFEPSLITFWHDLVRLPDQLDRRLRDAPGVDRVRVRLCNLGKDRLVSGVAGRRRGFPGDARASGAGRVRL